MSALNTAAMRLDPVQIPEAISQLSGFVRKSSESPYGLDNCLATLQFRHEMLKEINQ
jgi:hypothetical protein